MTSAEAAVILAAMRNADADAELMRARRLVDTCEPNTAAWLAATAATKRCEAIALESCLLLGDTVAALRIERDETEATP